MRILFLLSWQSAPGTVNPIHLAQHCHEDINPQLPDEKLAAIPLLQELKAEKLLDQH